MAKVYVLRTEDDDLAVFDSLEKAEEVINKLLEGSGFDNGLDDDYLWVSEVVLNVKPVTEGNKYVPFTVLNAAPRIVFKKKK